MKSALQNILPAAILLYFMDFSAIFHFSGRCGTVPQTLFITDCLHCSYCDDWRQHKLTSPRTAKFCDLAYFGGWIIEIKKNKKSIYGQIIWNHKFLRKYVFFINSWSVLPWKIESPKVGLTRMFVCPLL